MVLNIFRNSNDSYQPESWVILENSNQTWEVLSFRIWNFLLLFLQSKLIVNLFIVGMVQQKKIQNFIWFLNLKISKYFSWGPIASWLKGNRS